MPTNAQLVGISYKKSRSRYLDVYVLRLFDTFKFYEYYTSGIKLKEKPLYMSTPFHPYFLLT